MQTFYVSRSDNGDVEMHTIIAQVIKYFNYKWLLPRMISPTRVIVEQALVIERIVLPSEFSVSSMGSSCFLSFSSSLNLDAFLIQSLHSVV